MDISSWITGWASHTPDKTAIRFKQKSVSYAALALEIDLTAKRLSEYGMQSGDRLAWLGYNCPEMLTLVFACARLGVTLVPLNWRLAVAEHVFMLQDSGARLLLTQKSFATHCEGVKQSISTLDWETLDSFSRRSTERPIQHPAHTDSPVSFESPLLLVYTSGTTGKPKGAVLTQEAVFWNAVNSIHAHDMRHDDLVLTDLPMFHVGGLNIQTLPALHVGATVVLSERFDPAQTLDDIESLRPTIYLAVPATMMALLNHPNWNHADLSSLRCVMAGSSTIPVSLIQSFLDRGICVGQVYGSTETGPVAIYLRAEDAEAKAGSCGKAAVHCEAKIINAKGNRVEQGESGEILLRGKNLLSHYWNSKRATDEAFSDDWFHTGDIGHQDQDGFFYIDDRKKDVIISGGENIYPAEIENVLSQHEALAEWAVVGKPDDKWGEVPVALLVVNEGAEVDENSIRQLLADKLARFKHPKEIIFRDTLPKNVMGKVLKYELREELSEN